MSNPSTTAPAGWYDDGTGTGAQRYWDGTAWTDATQAPPAVPAQAVPATAPQRNVLGIVALAVAVLGFIFAAIPGALIVGWVLLPIAFILWYSYARSSSWSLLGKPRA
ncbi:DUF2510 domain-containing protein [Kitasatospora herbaricolor]|uniref:DUF2510 domain-containing protein n=1 Tax=Kitasatospora herbaricolor TaxID=68217 RepID=UPI0036D8B765